MAAAPPSNRRPVTAFSHEIAKRLGATKVIAYSEHNLDGLAVVLDDTIPLVLIPQESGDDIDIVLLYPHPIFGPCIPPHVFGYSPDDEFVVVAVGPTMAPSVVDGLLSYVGTECRRLYDQWCDKVTELEESQPQSDAVKMHGQTFGPDPERRKVAYWMDNRTIWRRSRSFKGRRIGTEWVPPPYYFEVEKELAPFENWIRSWRVHGRACPTDPSPA